MARASEPLDVWLYGRHLARLTEPSPYRYRLEFTEEALDTHGEGARILSLSLPISSRPTTDKAAGRWPVHTFLEGLLPEGNLRQQVARTAGVPTADKIGLLRQVGAECAGAVQILAAGATPGEGRVRRLDEGEVVTMVRDLPTYHFPEGSTLQASLAGIQDKVLLTRMADGAWGWPTDGASSTHIVKPEPIEGAVVAHLVETEEWTLRVAREVGLAAATAHVADFDGRRAIVVERYDRLPDRSRIHQEDFCQALGLEPGDKYERADGTPSRLSDLARAASPLAADPDAFRSSLLRAVTFNIAIGNGDAHSKNYSLLIAASGMVDLAPIYDAAPVMYLNRRFGGTGHRIADRTRIEDVAPEDLVSEASGWGMARPRAHRIVHEVMSAVHDVVHAVDLPDGAESVLANLDTMWSRGQWPTSTNTPPYVQR